MGKVKSIIAGIFAVVCLLGAGNTVAAQPVSEVYVSSAGSDTAAGTYAAPVRTLAAAYERAAGGATIYILDEVTPGDFSAVCVPEGTERVTICGLESTDGNPAIIFDDEEHVACLIPVDTVIRSIVLKDRCHKQEPAIYAQGNRLEIAEDVTVDTSQASDGKGLTIYGGSPEEALSGGTELTVRGGTWQAIYGGGREAATAQQASLTVGGNAIADEVFGGGRYASASVGSVDLTIAGGSFVTVCGGGDEADVLGEARVRFRYGTVGSLYGGGMERHATTGKTLVSIGDPTILQEQAQILQTYRGSGLRGGLSRGDGLGTAETEVYANALIGEGVVFCAGGYIGKVAKTRLTVYGGTILTDLYGGGFGIAGFTEFGNVRGDTLVEVKGGQITGNIYGGGYEALTHGVATVMVENGTIRGNIYGGGNAAGVTASEVVVALSERADVSGNIFGGSFYVTNSKKDIQETAVVELCSGTVSGSVFGGSDTGGSVSERVLVEISGTVTVTDGVFGGGRKAALSLAPEVTVLPMAVFSGDIYGGGRGEVSSALAAQGNLGSFLRRFGSSLADANVPETCVTIEGTVCGNVYGGGFFATVGPEDAGTWEQTVTEVKIEEGALVDGDIYGGGLGQDETDFALIYGSTEVTLRGGADESGAVFGGGENAPVAGETCVRVWDGVFSRVFGGSRDAVYDGAKAAVVVVGGSVTEVYGGGKGQAAVTGNASVTIGGGRVTTAYAGGCGAETEDAVLTILGGTVETAYGGGNTATVTGTTTLAVHTSDRNVDTVYAGSYEAPMDIQPTLELVSGRIGTVYCGGNAGIMTAADSDDVWYLTYEFDFPDIEIDNLFAGCNHTSDSENTSNVTLTLISGIYHTVYGGNNASGYMNNTNIVVNPDSGSDRTLGIGTVYGGGRLADSVKTQVTVMSYENAQYPLTIYGGGNRATVTKEISIRAGIGKNGTAYIEKLYSGNHAAKLAITPQLKLDDVEIQRYYDTTETEIV